MPRKELLATVKRIVVKIGTNIITENEKISLNKMSTLVNDIISLKKMGYEVVIVSSGAISAGSGALNRKRENLSIPQKQAFASVGQSILMNEYRKLFLDEGIEVGQILLTEDDVNNRKRFINARHTINTLLEFGVVPVVNENDTVAIDEIKFGDNDILSVHVSNIIEADLLILLSDVDGFYWDMSDSEPVEELCEITDEVITCAGFAGSIHGTGGMFSKIKAADIIIRSGEKMVIANGNEANVLTRIMSGEKLGTLFCNDERNLPSRKRWIAFNMKPKGKIMIDEGARNALCEEKKSLLSTGIIDIKGDFDQGDAVEIENIHSDLIGKGIVNYDCSELHLIMGKKTDEIREILGNAYYDEVINRDDLIVY